MAALRPPITLAEKIKNKGVVQCLEDWATASATEGFKLLTNLGLVELTGEYLVTKYPDRFSEKAVSAARVRIEQAATNH